MTISGKEIANNIRAERNRVRLTQAETAEKLGISERTYTSYEEDAKNIKSTDIYLLSKIFNCNINDFYINKKSTECE